MNRIYSFIITSILLCSCESSIEFAKPQPSGKNNLENIPKEMQGTYAFMTSSAATFDDAILLPTDEIFLTVTEKNIIQHSNAKFRTIKDSLDIKIDSTKIVSSSKNSLEIIDSKYSIKLEFEKDSVFGSYSYKDTIFNISKENLLRKLKRHYLLNYKKNSNSWSVKTLILKKEILTLATIPIPEDIELIEQITEVQRIQSDSNDVTLYRVNPSKKELQKLVKIRFSSKSTYRKIKKTNN